jgi:hypothetical protein
MIYKKVKHKIKIHPKMAFLTRLKKVNELKMLRLDGQIKIIQNIQKNVTKMWEFRRERIPPSAFLYPRNPTKKYTRWPNATLKVKSRNYKQWYTLA